MCLRADDFRERLARCRRSVAELGWAAILLTPGADLRYLCGYQAQPLERLTCLVVPAGGRPTLIVPRLERPAALATPAAAAGIAIVDYQDGADPYPLVRQALGGAVTAAGIGVAAQMWAAHLLALMPVLPEARWHPAGRALDPLRVRKSRVEVDALAEAGAAIDEVHRRMGDWLRPGRTETEVATDIATAMRRAGHATVDFTIVASGPNAASPHHEAADRVIEAGDPVVVDIGGTMPSGYCSDCTRTYVVGGPAPEDFLDYYRVLHDAQRSAVAAVRPGVSAGSVDEAARRVISEAGYGAQFLHRTGHGIGLDTHEEPYIVAGNDLILAEGMAFSIEPGIYLAGRHGARIEDIVVCTATGGRRLNTTPTDLVCL